MLDDSIIIKGNKEGLNAIINMDKFKDFDEMLQALVKRLSIGSSFYKGCVLKVTTQLKYMNPSQTNKLKDILIEEFFIKECIFEEKEEKINRAFTGVYEGKTKFLRKTLRSGQIINYSGNIVIIGDVNAGAEVYAAGNIIILGCLRGYVHAGCNGNSKAIVAALSMQPEILRISEIFTRSPEDIQKPQYPEVARIKDNMIIVEPYLPNKYF